MTPSQRKQVKDGKKKRIKKMLENIHASQRKASGEELIRLSETAIHKTEELLVQTRLLLKQSRAALIGKKERSPWKGKA